MIELPNYEQKSLLQYIYVTCPVVKMGVNQVYLVDAEALVIQNLSVILVLLLQQLDCLYLLRI